ncbi:MAG: hypothetical protein Ta2D_02490 [Rickettsiales bacterium]|nr:MAG: hypothetical protein Ta2D_02490 [Rickettsiales bacterium]
MKKVLILLTLVLSIVACSTTTPSNNNDLALSVATEMATSKETNAAKKQKACLKVFDTKCKEKNKDNGLAATVCTPELAKTTCETALKK